MRLWSDLACLGTNTTRRSFLLSGFASLLSLAKPAASFAGLLDVTCTGDCPLRCILEKKRATLEAFIEAQLVCLWNGCPGDRPSAIADDLMHFLWHLPKIAHQAVCLTLTSIEWRAARYAHRSFAKLTVDDRLQLLNQGEYRGKSRFPMIRWEEEYTFHTSVSSLALLVRLITHSREPARRRIGFSWSAACQNPSHLTHVPAPADPDLTATYDVCVIGSGAGGGIVAARAAEAGYRVLIVEEGEWISPDELVQRVHDEEGREVIWPARDDVGLRRLYQGHGIQLAGRLTDPEIDDRSLEDYLDDEGVPGLTLLSKLKHHSRPRQTINILQARVVGGGPYINNAIHLPIEEAVWNAWPVRPPHVTFAQLQARMDEVVRDLGVNVAASQRYSGARTAWFVQGCERAGIASEPLPVAIAGPDASEDPQQSCAVCGADNIVDPFGTHTDGIHLPRPSGPRSYLMRAFAAGAQVARQMRAWQFQVTKSSSGERRVTCLMGEDLRGIKPHQRGPYVPIHARAFVLCAGAGASTALLRRTSQSASLSISGLGAQYSANVVTPVYAVFDRPIVGHNDPVEPGIAQCFYVRRVRSEGAERAEPALENWFHYPGSLAIALTGWFQDYAALMQRYNHLSICGMVVPTKIRPDNHIDACGKVRLTIDCDEFELLLAGIRKIGRIYLAAATADNGVSLHLPTKALLMDRHGHALQIRTLQCLDGALQQIRERGPEFLNLATAHPQGGNPLGTVVHPRTFRVQLADHQILENLFVADASLLPAGCEVNPQLTIKGLAMFAADALLEQLPQLSTRRAA